MKNLIYLLSFLLISSCVEKNKYTLTGSFNGDQNEEWIYLSKVPPEKGSLDSAKIINGKFKFEGNIEQPEMYALHYQFERITGMAWVILEPTDLHVEINLDSWDMYSKVTGGKLNNDYSEFNTTQINKFYLPQKELHSKMKEVDSEKKEVLKDSIKLLMDEQYKFQTDFIKNHPESPASMYLMFMLGNDIPLEERGKMLNNIHPNLHKTLFYERLLKDYETQVEVKENPMGINFLQNAELMDINFNEDSLLKTLVDSNPGKALYIDIWATWCGPCKEEFPHSKKLFSEIDQKKIQMVYFCIRSPKETWQKTIAEQELPGQHYLIGDETYKKFINVYGIEMNGIPHYLIVGKDGKMKYKNAPRPSSDETLKILTELIN